MSPQTIKHLREYKQHYPDNYNSERQIQAWFGFNDETPVVWIKYAIHDSGKIDLWTIETREEYRNQGYSKQALNLLKEKHGVDAIHHDGGYTPEGFKYIAHQVTWVPCHTSEPVQNFDSMNFVEEWNIYTAY